ncbi:hypothetical protein RchiOBHm_Chr6g0302861 [Rosa chinensis]|uniref:Uncharacterized protein n=1 Tax=Rosa chinensis TaxID=74649 RepID=A0A2P6PZ37_ROSCH|nr:interaptin [Rosa chinensis]PRQ27207.1 hypothetical protein RchiOBHm_Chr6g0302861 [Rosa chinensis]
MGTVTRSKSSSESQNWEHIFNAMVQILQEQQSKLETMAKERKMLADRIRTEHDKWAFSVSQLQDQISQLEADLVTQEKGGVVEVAKLELLLGLKEREAVLFKFQKEDIKRDLDDFIRWVELHAKESSDSKVGGESSKRKGRNNSNTKLSKTINEEKRLSKGVDDDLRKLQQEYDKLALEKKTEVSALLSQKQFVWNQYNLLEKDYTSKLKSKQSEVDQADEKIQALLASMEQLQSSNKEKDDKIASLETDFTKLKEENSKVLRELESLRKSASASVTPVLNHCSAGTRAYNLRGKNSALDRSIVTVKKESSAAQLTDPLKNTKMGRSSSKRNGDDVITTEGTVKLFSSSFKVPKVKSHCPASGKSSTSSSGGG